MLQRREVLETIRKKKSVLTPPERATLGAAFFDEHADKGWEQRFLWYPGRIAKVYINMHSNDAESPLALGFGNRKDFVGSDGRVHEGIVIDAFHDTLGEREFRLRHAFEAFDAKDEKLLSRAWNEVIWQRLEHEYFPRFP